MQRGEDKENHAANEFIDGYGMENKGSKEKTDEKRSIVLS